MKKDYQNLLEKIINLDSFGNVFKELKKIDKKKALEIENSLKKCIKENHSKINKRKKDKKNLKYLLYKEKIELKAHSSSYLSYSEMVATTENALLKFAVNLIEQFFTRMADELNDYFNTKITIMNKELENNASWYAGLKDTSKKMGSILNFSKQKLKLGLDTVGLGRYLDEKEIINTKSIVEKLLEIHLSQEIVGKDIAQKMEQANKKYKDRWEKELKTQSPDLNKLKAFASSYDNNNDIKVGFELGAAEQTFFVGIASSVVGTVGLAAGWHTITYAMLNVFPPIAIFAILGTVVVAAFTKDKALVNRKKQISEVVKQYHKYFLLQIEIEKLKELNGKTLREAMIEQSQKIINETIKQWYKTISGNLQIEHYQLLMSAVTKHLMLIDECLKLI